MTRNIEKEPLLLIDKRDIVSQSEFSTTCPSFTLLLSKSFMRFPQLTKMSLMTTEEIDSESDSDDDTNLPDLPYVANPVLLGGSIMSAGEKLRQLRILMKEHGIGVYIIPSEDEHQSEYTAEADMRRQYISGFTGSAGLCVVTLDDDKNLTGKAALSTDGRYFLQAEKQLDLKHWTLLKQGIASYPTWKQFAIREAIGNKFSNVISCDPRLISVSVGEYFERIRVLQYENKFNFSLLLEVNLVDVVWGKDKPTRSLDPIYVLPLQYSGESTENKLNNIRKILQSKKSTHLVISALDEVAWLFNLRADSDIPFSPVFFSYALVTLESVILYIDKTKIDNGAVELHLHLAHIKGLTIKSYKDFYSDLSQLKSTTSQSDLLIVLPERAATNYALYSYIPQSFAKQSVKFDSIISNLKLTKNKSELFNAKIAQFKDSLAFILLISWLKHQIIDKHRAISEYDAACKIYCIRSKLPNFKGLSYETISSSGPNAAIIHYAPTKEDNSIIDPSQVYLLDSGAHYLEGTTDITRTFLFGNPKDKNLEEYKKYYTLVLKGHLAVAMAKFPPNSSSTGTILDAYSRQPLWNEGLDFNHGTGHGVGSFGNVHEGPLYILTTAGGANNLDIFKKGAILTDEPGYYVDGECGFRIESELEIIESSERFGKTRNGDSFLCFGYLTKVPFCRKLISTKHLSSSEVSWINEYHKSVREDFCNKLLEIGNKRAYNWLLNETKPL